MADIARWSGVSQPTVSDVLNNKWRTKGIARQTRDHVLAVARKHHYRRHGIARRLATGKTHLIGMVLPYIADSFFAEIAFALEAEARRHNYLVVLCHSYNEHTRAREMVDLLRELCVDGMVIVPTFDNPLKEMYVALKRDGMPFVMLDSCVDGIHGHFVGTDDRLGGYLATRHLLDLGHRRIAHLAGPQSASTTRGRLLGYRQALEECGLSFDAGLVAEMDVTQDASAGALMGKWMSLARPPTAIFAASDNLATGAVRELRDMGRAVPQEIAVVGFGDLRSAGSLEGGLTTMRQPTAEIGRAAAELLVRAIQEPDIEPERIVLKPELVVRGSCGGRAESAAMQSARC